MQFKTGSAMPELCTPALQRMDEQSTPLDLQISWCYKIEITCFVQDETIDFNENQKVRCYKAPSGRKASLLKPSLAEGYDSNLTQSGRRTNL